MQGKLFNAVEELDSIESVQDQLDVALAALDENKERGKGLKLEVDACRRLLRNAIKDAADRKREARGGGLRGVVSFGRGGPVEPFPGGASGDDATMTGGAQ